MTHRRHNTTLSLLALIFGGAILLVGSAASARTVGAGTLRPTYVAGAKVSGKRTARSARSARHQRLVDGAQTLRPRYLRARRQAPRRALRAGERRHLQLVASVQTLRPRYVR